ncbi:serine hydrolase [Candidatus Woesebacteria bacterium]|nr:serine hydrolase [Candidatus Woesebacteria bacterium]
MRVVLTFVQAHRGMVFLCVGICMGWFGLLTFQYVAENIQNTENRFEARQQGQYKYINPLLECEQAQKLGYKYYKATFDDVQKIIDTYKKNGQLTDAGIYFRDLNNGPWYSINENALFEPASMFKLPLLVTLYKKRETDRGLFDQKLSVILEKDESQNVKPSASAQVGASYTIRELIEYMIKYSDNNAAQALFSFLDPKYTTEIFNDLGMNTLQDANKRFVVSVRNYSSIYRLLFNSSYLSRSDSEEILELLTQTEFNNGLRKSIPSHVPLAHKFGERESQDLQENSSYQLHDCGIVYYPGRPFLLCIMTKGTNSDTLTKVIQEISKSVYDTYDEKMKKL